MKRAQPCATRIDTARIGSSCIPAGAYSFSPDGKDQYELTYPKPVLKALIDETHRLGKKTGCHNYGGEGMRNAIELGCDTIEHGFGLNQKDIDLIVSKGLFFEPTFTRYTEPYMDDNDAKSTGGKYRMIPIFEKAVTWRLPHLRGS